MKITKSKLRKMIKEEIQKLDESVWSPAYKGDMQGSAKILEKAFKAITYEKGQGEGRL